MNRDERDSSSCDGCDLYPNRRDFLRFGGLAAIATALASVGASPSALRAMGVAKVSGTRGTKFGRNTVSYPLPVSDVTQIDHDNDVILVRWQNEVHAFNLSCPHQRTALRWDDADHRFECPKHHSKYEPGGEFISGRATRNMDRFPVRRDASNNIVVDVDGMIRSDQDLAAWTAAGLKV
ncbi:MAG: Rieske (2Fe-2S) protein [Gemmatimonadota bacterium]|nr:Rieske (2Fe-2S) protein [Gemmatimonadota bacterium]